MRFSDLRIGTVSLAHEQRLRQRGKRFAFFYPPLKRWANGRLGLRFAPDDSLVECRSTGPRSLSIWNVAGLSDADDLRACIEHFAHDIEQRV